MASRIFYGLYHLLPFKRLLIIIINISQYRSDAIILQNVGDPVIVPLTKTLPTILALLSSQFATACALHGKDSARLTLPILRSLWDNIAFPVRTQLVALESAGQVANLVVSNLCIMWFTTTCCWDLFVKGPQTK